MGLKTINDFTNPFHAILAFEQAIAEYTGAPYCVSTNSCSHAMEIAFRLTFNGKHVSFPAHTYLSVLMTLKKLEIDYTLTDDSWKGEYQFAGSNIWDSARQLSHNMFRPGTIQCISFGRTKPLEIGHGGCLLTDNYQLYKAASCMRSDGRDLFAYSPWINQNTFNVGYHYNMRPEDCVIGLNLLANQQFTEQIDKFYNYPDCRNLNIVEYQMINLEK
jgi:dTDP-4-amino-4,6-dideoxygalactose transaminase